MDVEVEIRSIGLVGETILAAVVPLVNLPDLSVPPIGRLHAHSRFVIVRFIRIVAYGELLAHSQTLLAAADGVFARFVKGLELPILWCFLVGLLRNG